MGMFEGRKGERTNAVIKLWPQKWEEKSVSKNIDYNQKQEKLQYLSGKDKQKDKCKNSPTKINNYL